MTSAPCWSCGAIVAGVLFAAGVPLRWFVFVGVPFAAMAAAYS